MIWESPNAVLQPGVYNIPFYLDLSPLLPSSLVYKRDDYYKTHMYVEYCLKPKMECSVENSGIKPILGKRRVIIY